MLGFLWNTGKRRALANRYGQQRAALDAAHEETGADVFVSPFDILIDQNGNEFSYSTWPEGVTAWLPRTECIAFTGGHSGTFWFLMVRWEDVDAICPS